MRQQSRPTLAAPVTANVTADGADDVATDAAVIALSRREPEAFATLFSRHAPALKQYAVRRLGTEAAEDIVAEAFIVAFRKRASYDLTFGDARPWLYGIATNLIARHRRSEIDLYRALSRTGADPVMEPFTDRVEQRVAAGGMRGRLADALAGLPDGHRDALLLVTWGRLSYEDAAQSLGVAVGTVRSRVNRARKKLRRTLGDIDPTAVNEEFPRG
ncbi:DNA-directed RNA polymerase sigma-70 factor [Microtetraspora sp. NBRC 13810]|uniref:RNA polymerase sigma factor n=1 Tax=Microtetraspora sp. NBRC 13810 TaxID=3030990 RepID=UPI0024A2136C|nr:RNA polymerase sigma factor [Microtetraspora sp. NBRC 13810]GLW10963.1 DNA-directed RNA polymerase sigma-70 factor [Microtetraspora sp. NBRC 13810]